MIDKDQKNAILAAEAEFERKENLARALAESGVTLIGKITSGPPKADKSIKAADETILLQAVSSARLTEAPEGS
ncbi:hypothetical protein MMB232_01209 [Brevundimonas subvibrioides]|uniref:hypothetical protein n=1 Tax=Brevundimonas subvibrioides TaxID=74313 RepID=UPI0032D56F7F